MSLVGVSKIVIAIGIVIVILVLDGFISIPEGHVGVHYRFGRLMNTTSSSGLNIKLPFITSTYVVQITMQTDNVKDIPCGTSSGVMLYFKDIEVVNQLNETHLLDTIAKYGVNYDKMWIFDRIHHEINQFCSKNTVREVAIDNFSTIDEIMMKAIQDQCDRFVPGLRIISIRITKPILPVDIEREFLEREKQIAIQSVNREKALLAYEHEQNEKKLKALKASSENEVKQLHLEQLIRKEWSEKNISVIRSEAEYESKKLSSEAMLYDLECQAKGNTLLYTNNFVKLETARALASNTKIFFGDKLEGLYSQFTNKFIGNTDIVEEKIRED